MIPIDMWDFRLFVRECVKTGEADEIIKILAEENVIPQGEWDKRHTELLKYFVKCEKCGEEIMTSHKNFCPNCGADMRGEEE